MSEAASTISFTGTPVAGVDGCRGGWVCVTAAPHAAGLRLVSCAVFASLEELIEATGECAAVAIDIPIGLSQDGRRAADTEARRRLGPRRSSVFPPPPRLLLSESSYRDANELSKAKFGRGLSRQAFGILPKIREADRVLSPRLQARVVESHPEVSFWALAGERPLAHYKRTREGLDQRIALLESVYGTDVRALARPPKTQWDDVYDACVLAWTAAHVASGTAVHLPQEPQRDSRGLRMEIVF